jgi:predicted RNA-binding protein with TRAM domain
MALEEKKITTKKSKKAAMLGSSNKKTTLNTKGFRNSKKIKAGDICLLKISALGPKGIGIDEYSYPYSIFVPNTNLGETVKAKIVKNNLKEDKYAVAQVLEVIKKSTSQTNLTVQPDEELTVNITKLTSKGAGLVDLKDGYKLIIPNATIGNNIKVVITRLKSKYAFAKIVVSKEDSVNTKNTTNLKNKFIRR